LQSLEGEWIAEGGKTCKQKEDHFNLLALNGPAGELRKFAAATAAVPFEYGA
jgi:hypothetical protein